MLGSGQPSAIRTPPPLPYLWANSSSVPIDSPQPQPRGHSPSILPTLPCSRTVPDGGRQRPLRTGKERGYPVLSCWPAPLPHSPALAGPSPEPGLPPLAARRPGSGRDGRLPSRAAARPALGSTARCRLPAARAPGPGEGARAGPCGRHGTRHTCVVAAPPCPRARSPASSQMWLPPQGQSTPPKKRTSH